MISVVIPARDADAKILIFSMHEDVVFSSQALQAGARGYITKASAPEVLVEAVQAIARGERYIGHDMAQKPALHGMLAHENCPDALTEREFEVLRPLAAGHSLPAISKLLRLNYKTVPNYQSSIRQKLGIENNVQCCASRSTADGCDPSPEKRRKRVAARFRETAAERELPFAGAIFVLCERLLLAGTCPMTNTSRADGRSRPVPVGRPRAGLTAASLGRAVFVPASRQPTAGAGLTFGTEGRCLGASPNAARRCRTQPWNCA